MAAMKYFMKKLWSNERGRKIKCNEFKSVRDWAAGWRWSCPSGAGDDDDMICLADAACCRRCDYPQILATRLLEINHDPFERPFPRNYSIGWRQRPRHTAQKKQKKKSLPSKSIPNLLVSQQLLGNRQRYFLKIYFRLNVILLEAIFSSKLITSLLFLDIENSVEV